MNHPYNYPRLAGLALHRSKPAPDTRQAKQPSASVSERFPPLVRWTFLLFIFTIPLENANLPVTVLGLVSLARLAGLIFQGACVLYWKRCFGPLPSPSWLFVAYVGIFAVSGLLLPSVLTGWHLSLLFKLVQLLAFFWLASRIFRNRSLATTALLVFSLACAVAAAGMLWRYEPGQQRRLAIAEVQDPNVAGLTLSAAVLILLGFILQKRFSRGWKNYGLIGLTLLLLLAVTLTASRTAMLAFITGVATFLLSIGWSKHRLRTVAFGSLVAAAFVYLVMINPLAALRWEATFQRGETSGRLGIYVSSLKMISERPLVGWQPITMWYELGRRTDRVQRDTHNLYLHVFAETGLLGGLPFLLGLILCLWTAWKGRNGELGNLPLAILITVLVASLGINTIYNKSLWLFLALALASVPLSSPVFGKHRFSSYPTQGPKKSFPRVSVGRRFVPSASRRMASRVAFRRPNPR